MKMLDARMLGTPRRRRSPGMPASAAAAVAAVACAVITGMAGSPIVTNVAAQEPQPPNIVLILADDLGYGDTGYQGHHTLRTPVLDRLADEGLRFTSYYAPSPLCSPSRASLLTGRIHFRTGIESWIPPDTDVQLRSEEITIAELLRQRGYDTMLAGKWHLNGGLGQMRHTQPHDQGFDHWLALHAWAVPHHRDPTNFFRNGVRLGEIEGFAGQIVVDEAIGWLDQREAAGDDDPFFLYLPFVEPHSTIASPDEYNDMYAAFTRGEPDPFPNGGTVPADNLEARGPGEYWANVTWLDHEIERVLVHLDDLGVRDDTVVIFTSDNGPVTEDWRHWWEVNIYGTTGGFRGRKADLYEGGIRVPAIVRWPGRVAAGSVTDAPVSGYDFLPTLASIAGYEVPGDRPIDGEDLSPLLRGESFERERPLYWEFDDDLGHHFALRDGKWKLLADEALERIELYDLEEDPFEGFDLAAARPDIVEASLEELRRIRESVANDPLRPRARVPRASTEGWGDTVSRVLVLTAMPLELEPLLEGASIDTTVTVNGRTHHLGTLGGVDVVLVAGGVSMVNATMAAQAALSRFPISAIVYSGIAGGANPDMGIGDVSVPSRWAQYQEHVFTDVSRTGWRRGWRSEALGSFGMMYPQRVRVAREGSEPKAEDLVFWFDVDRTLLETARVSAVGLALDRCATAGQCVDHEPRVVVGGNGVSGPTFVDDAAYRDWVWETFAPDGFDMETAAVAHVATSNGVPMIGVRAISDLAGGTPGENLVTSFAPMAAANAAKVVIALLEALRLSEIGT